MYIAMRVSASINTNDVNDEDFLGVGRAFGTICAYYHFVKKVPLAKVHYDLAPIRSCGFFDRVFLENAAVIYKRAYD